MTNKQIIFFIGFLIFISGLLKIFGIELPELRGGYSKNYILDMIMGIILMSISLLFKKKKDK